MSYKIAILHSTIRKDEKLLIDAARQRGVEPLLIDVREQVLNPFHFNGQFDLVLDRCVSTVKGLQSLLFFESLGVLTVNRFKVASLCADKFATSLLLHQHGVPVPRFALVFGENQALEAIEQLGGFPIVIKPTHGSWGRLLAKVNDKESLEAILEHKLTLGSPQHHSFLLQEYIEKPGRDIRAFVIDEAVICAIYRYSSHWITNTARGAEVKKCEIFDELRDLCSRVSEVLGGGILGIDFLETREGLKVNEVNHATEFKNSEEPSGVSISGQIIDYCLNCLSKR